MSVLEVMQPPAWVQEETPTPLAFRFTPRWYQRELFRQMAPRDLTQAKKHGMLVWPRRRGKDLTALNFLCTMALRRRGSYYYFFPTYRLGKRIIWDGIDDAGVSFREYLPGEIVVKESESEMQTTLANGSLIYILGADNIDITARGTNVVGVVYSEFRDMSPVVRRTIAPILGNNDGWELIVTTPRGHNHVWDLVQAITKDEVLARQWYYSFHTIESCATSPADLEKTAAHIDALRREGVPEEWIQQEYYCDFSGFQEGSFFGEQMARLYQEQRVVDLPIIDQAKVHTACDLGVGVSFAVWFWQEVGDWVHVIDYEELVSGGIPEYAAMLREKGYKYGDHFAPFDAKGTDIGTGQKRIDTAADLDVFWLPLPKVKAMGDRVNAGRLVFARAKFDQMRCQKGLSHLLNYRREYDEQAMTYIEKEVHDSHSHGGAAFCYLGMAVSEIGTTLRRMGRRAETDFDEFDYDRRWTRTAEDGYGLAVASGQLGGGYG